MKTMKTFNFTIWTDGGCSLNPGTGGYGILIVDNATREQREIKQGFIESTNNRMELRAVIRAINEIPKEAAIKLYTDSTYVVRHAYGDEKRNKNLDLWELYEKAMNEKINKRQVLHRRKRRWST